MKYLIFTGILILGTYSTFSQQRYTSQNNTTGFWEEFIWTKSASWMNDRPRYDDGTAAGYGYWHQANIYGYVTRNGDMQVANGGALHIYDTLRITGNLLSQQQIIVHDEGILIVEGDLISNNGGVNTVGGTVVVLGNLTTSNGARINLTGDFYVLGTETSPGSGERFNGNNNPPPGFLQDEDDLSNNVSLYNFAMGGTLPVEFADVQIHMSGSASVIRWTTYSEKNNDYFTIERSEDGINFQEIGILKGGNSSTVILHYVFTDLQPLTGISYYRIRQTDFDGTTGFSPVQRLENEFSTSGSVQFYPNPASDRLELAIMSQDPVYIRIIDLDGSVVRQQTFNPEDFHASSIAVGDLKRGCYLLEIQTGSTRRIEKIWLQ